MSENYLEKAILKLGRQLAAFDEASLMSLWERYAEKVRRFEPTKAWEESVLVFCMLQSMRLKNQLFNHHWALSRQAGQGVELDLAALTSPEPPKDEESEPVGGAKGAKQGKRGKLLELKPRDQG